jgi:hypothetical protein
VKFVKHLKWEATKFLEAVIYNLFDQLRPTEIYNSMTQEPEGSSPHSQQLANRPLS